MERSRAPPRFHNPGEDSGNIAFSKLVDYIYLIYLFFISMVHRGNP